MNPQTWNRYAYVGGNPVSHIDPSGLDYNGPISPTQGETGFTVGSTVTCSDCGSAPGVTLSDEGGANIVVGTGFGCILCNHSLSARKDIKGWDKIRHNLATEYLQEKVIVQDTLQNFVDEFKEGGCVHEFVEGADKVDVMKAMTTNQPDFAESTITAASSGAGFYYASGAGAFAAGHALLRPWCSATYRTIVGGGAKVAEGFGAVYIFAQTVAGSVQEYKAMYNGECQ